MTQPDVSALARKWAVDVDLGTPPTETWTRIMGMMEFKPAWNPNLEDDSVYEDEGWGSSTKTANAFTLEAKVVRRHDPADEADYDPAQEALRTKAYEFGAAGIAHIRWYDRFGGPEAYEGYAEVSWVPDGGPHTALETVVVTLTGKGKPTEIANPAAASS